MTISLCKGIRSTPNDSPLITPDMEGLWFAGSSSRTADELCAAVVLEAIGYGWTVAETDELTELAQSAVSSWLDSADDAQWLSDSAYDAESYLNTLAPTGYMFAFDDGFGLWAWDDESGDFA